MAALSTGNERVMAKGYLKTKYPVALEATACVLSRACWVGYTPRILGFAAAGCPSSKSGMREVDSWEARGIAMPQHAIGRTRSFVHVIRVSCASNWTESSPVKYIFQRTCFARGAPFTLYNICHYGPPTALASLRNKGV